MFNQRELVVSANFGAVTRVLLETDRKLFKLASIAVQVLPAIRVNQIYVHFSERGEPVGYVVWAFLSERTASEYSTDAERVLHYSEWNEGLQPWVIDFVAPFGHAREMAACLRKNVFIHHNRVRGLKRGRDGSIRRVIEVSWARPIRADDENAGA